MIDDTKINVFRSGEDGPQRQFVIGTRAELLRV